MSYDESEDDLREYRVEEGLTKSAEEESEAARRNDYYGHHTSAGAPAGERRAATQLWLISYADFMTILLIFFLVMYGYTYLARATLLAKRSDAARFSDFTRIVYGLKSNLGANNVMINEEGEKITIQLKDQVLFPSGSDKLSSSAHRTLEDLAESLKLMDGPVIVEGHTDNVPIMTGKYPSNWELSAARAFSVIDALTHKGVPPERLAAWGFGEYRPLASNENAEGRGLNRRIAIVVFRNKKA